eukprot:g5728.t1
MSLDLKLVLLGHKSVGKTCLFNRYVYDEWGHTSMTIGAYFGMKQMRVNGRQVNLAIWDTAGEEKFDSLTNFYCRGAKAALICYDVTDEKSFNNKGLSKWVDKIKNEAEENCVILIVGNKLDLVETDPNLRQVNLAEAQRYAKSVGAHVIEASAKSGQNIDKIFQTVVQLALERQTATKAETNNPGLDINPANAEDSSCSC